MDSGQLITTSNDTGPSIRILHCHDCRSLEELPTHDGPPETDVLLQILVEKHQTEGHPHIGNLFVVPVKYWERNDSRMEIIRQIKGGGSKGLDEFDANFYDSRSTFSEDALVCYRQHLSPKDGCPDYMADKKKLLPNTNAERKDLGLAPVSKSPVHIHLCRFCPVHAVVMQKMRDLKGLSQ